MPLDAARRAAAPGDAQASGIAVEVLVRISADVVFHRHALGAMSDEGGRNVIRDGVDRQQLSLDLDAA